MSSLDHVDPSISPDRTPPARGSARGAKVRPRRRRGAIPWRDRLLWLEPFWIALLAPSLLLPGRFWIVDWQPVLVLLLFAFWPLRLAGARRRHVHTPLDWPLLLLLGTVIFSLALHSAAYATWEAAGYLLLGVAAFGALVNWPPLRRHPVATAWPLAAAGAALALAGPWLLSGVADKLGMGAPLVPAGPLATLVGESVNPNVLAGALVILFPLPAALALAPRWSAWHWRLFWSLIALLLLAELVMTQSRGAYLAALVALLLIVMLRWPGTRYVLVPLAPLLLAVLISGAGLALVFDAVGDMSEGAPSGSLESMLERTEIWSRGRQALAHAPLTGIGLGHFPTAVTAAQDSQTFRIEAPTHAHNLLLQVGVELGVVGLVAYAALLLGVGAMLVALLRRRHRRGHNQRAPDVRRRRLRWALAAGSLAALVGIFVHGMVDAAAWGNKLAFLPWLLFALDANLFLAAVRRREVRTHAETETESV